MKISIDSIWVKFWYLCTKYKIFNFFWFYLKKFLFDSKNKKILKWIINTDEKELIDEYENKKKEILSQILSIKNWSNVFIPLLDWGAWDIAYRFIYLKEIFYYLSNKKCSLYIVSHEKYGDIIKIISQYFKINYIKSENYKKTNDIIEDWNIKILIKEKKWIVLNHCLCISGFPFLKLFYKNGDHKRNIFWYTYNFAIFLNKELNWWKKIILKKQEYNFDTNKIKNLRNMEKIILCNYESKTFNMPCFDRIKFKTYLKQSYNIWKITNKKVIINSVYNKEKLSENKEISIKSFTFQEVIYLAENNLIDIFISERNWLNDVFYVFYPQIKQIIYYPDGCWFLTKFKAWDLWTNKNYDISLLNLRRIPNGNNIQDYRKNFISTIQKYINILNK